MATNNLDSESSANENENDVDSSSEDEQNTNVNKVKVKYSKEQVLKFLQTGKGKRVPASWTSSEVWKEYDSVSINDYILREFAICKRCRLCLSVPGGSTTTLLRHLNIHNRSGSATSTGTSSHSQTRLTAFVKKTKIPVSVRDDIGRATVYFVAADMQPLSVVNDRGFLNISQRFLDIGAKYGTMSVPEIMFDRTTLSKTLIPKYYDEAKANLIQELSEIKHVAVTTDHWTDDLRKFSYQAFTVHYITKEFVLQSRCLGLYEFEGSKTATAVKTKTNEILKSVLPNSLVGNVIYVTDNGSNMKAAFKNDVRVSCAGHNINLVIDNAMKSQTLASIQDMIKNAKEVVAYFKHSGKNKLLSHTLKQDVSTRWNSEFLMLESVQKTYDEISKILTEDRQFEKLECLQIVDKEGLAHVIEFLRPFNTASEMLSAENIVTAHKVLPILHKLKNHCAVRDRDPDVIREAKPTFMTLLNEKFPIHPIHITATVLAPVFRELSFLSENERDSMYRSVRAKIEELESEDSEHIDHNEPPVKISKLQDDFLADMMSVRQRPLNSMLVTRLHEFDIYMQNAAMSTEEEPLEFWNRHRNDLPVMASIARQIFCVPATSTPSERVFSLSGAVLSERRANMKPETLEMLVFLKYNMLKT